MAKRLKKIKKFFLGVKLHMQLHIIFYGTIITTVFTFITSLCLTNLDNAIVENYPLQLNTTTEINKNPHIDEIKSSNISESRIAGSTGRNTSSTARSIGGSSITNINKNKIEYSHFNNKNIVNDVKLNNTQYRDASSNKYPPIKVGPLNLELGEITNNSNNNVSKKWQSDLKSSVAKTISEKTLDLDHPPIKFTEEELEKRMDLTTDASKRSKAILDLENTKDPVKCKLFLYVKEYYNSINQLDYYECFLLDYYTSSDARMKVDNIIDEIKSSEKIIETKYDKKNFNDISSPEKESAAHVSTMLNPYGHPCMYYKEFSGKIVFSVFTHGSGIINSNVFNTVFNNYYKLHLISKSDLNGDPYPQYATSFIHQENQIPGFIKNISPNQYNTLHSFIYQSKVYQRIKDLVNLGHTSDSVEIINKLKSSGVIK